MLAFFARQLVALADAVPLGEAPAAAARGGMLRDEDGVALPGRLLAIVGRMRRRQPLRDEVARMVHHGIEALVAQVLRVPGRQFLRRAEARSSQAREQLVEVPQSCTSPLGL